MKFPMVLLILCIAMLSACGGGQGSGSQEKSMPTETAIRFKEINKLLGQIERKADKVLTSDATVNDMKDLYELCEDIEFDYDPLEMEPEAADQCEALQHRIDSLKSSVKERMEALNADQLVAMLDVEDEVIEKTTGFPIYLERGDKLYFAVDAEKTVDVRIYNTDSRQLLKTYAAKHSVLDSLDIKNKGVYLINVTPKVTQYVDVRVGYKAGSLERLLYVKEVEAKEVDAKQGDFLATSVKGIKMTNLFEEPRKFTLRSQFKATFSNTSNTDRAIVAIQIPAGATDVLYSLRISTSEGSCSSDGEFSDNLTKSYKKIKILGLPVYEKQSNHGSSIIGLILGENQPPREEEAYINMYVFYNAAQAKRFQDGADVSKLQYSIDYSRMGTQSCNGRIPSKGQRTVYLGFRNERVRYSNYVWLEAVSAVPITEYFKPEYIVK